MNRLQSELRRLYLPRAAAGDGSDAAAPGLVDARGATRALVLEIAAHAGWDAVSRVWRGCQAEFELPAPAIAVSGTDAFQLWFSLEEPVAVADAHAFLQSLRVHFLADVDARQVRVLPAAVPGSPGGAVHAAMVPARQPHPQEARWSAFLAPDLAPLFSETPWLDIAPGVDGQADLLCRLASIGKSEFEAAADRLAPTPRSPSPAQAPSSAPDAAAPVGAGLDPRSFLLRVMGDESVPLALRIEAARTLLEHGDRRATPPVDPFPSPR
jgi:hypothetical protein